MNTDKLLLSFVYNVKFEHRLLFSEIIKTYLTITEVRTYKRYILREKVRIQAFDQKKEDLRKKKKYYIIL